MTPQIPARPAPDGTATFGSYPHRLQLLKVDLVGGGREVAFKVGLNLIIGDITTGKTTFVRLIRAMLGTMPHGLPPEVNYVQAIRGHVGPRSWTAAG